MEGVLPSQAILELIQQKHLSVVEAAKHVQPNSIDLPFGKQAWRLSSIRTPRHTETVQEVISELAIENLDLTKPTIFERNAVYIVALDASAALPADIKGECDSKSSTGRIDVQTRLLTDRSERYDYIAPNYTGPLYLFVSSNSFLIRVKEGLCLNQARFSRGDPVLNDSEVKVLVDSRELLYVHEKPVKDNRVHRGVIMRLDLRQPISGYRAKFTNHVVDLLRYDNPQELFWEPISGGKDAITLERDEFYILSTLEHIRVPHEYCAWIPPFRPEYGEFRSHYAGFLDTGFGYANGELLGSATTLEVRSHDNSLTLLHGTPVAPVLFLKLSEKPSMIYSVHTKSSYQSQTGPKLAKYFT